MFFYLIYFLLEPHPVVNILAKLDEANPYELVHLSWKTIGNGDNITVRFFKY